MRGRLACLVVGWAACVGVAAVADVREALDARDDVWGERAMAQPGGPTYEFFEGLLPPPRYVDCEFRHYPIALSAPFAKQKARFVSNGAGVNLVTRVETKRWYEFPVGVGFRVNGQPFGKQLARVEGPSYERGYLPIVRVGYRVGDVVVEQEAFVPPEGTLGEHAVVMVRFTAKGGEAEVGAEIDGENRKRFVFAGNGWEGDDMALKGKVGGGKSLVLAVASLPIEPGDVGAVNEETYQKWRERCAEVWEAYVGRCAKLDVPEERVNRAWRSTVVANLMMAAGQDMSYSAGNVYQRLYEAESGDALRALALYGLEEESRSMVDPLLRYVQKGLGFHDAAFKLQMLSHLYWLTRDADFVHGRRALWGPSVQTIVDGREKQSGLLPKENYCGDIHTQVYSLNSNANCWRGLRDIAAVLADIGEDAEAKRIAAIAAEFKTKILAGLEKSERRDVTPTFIPIAMFGAEQPYDRLTDTMMGAYWNLMIPYVLGSGILDEPRERAAIDYLQTHGGLCMGMIRFHQHSGLFANEDGLDDLYGLRYTQALLRRDEVDRVLVSFYGKLAQGFTRDTFVDGEGSSLKGLDADGRPMFLPPNASANGFFLTMLREMLVQDQDEDGDGRPETLRLLLATPGAWMADGKEIHAENMATAFGRVSVVSKAELSEGRVAIDVTLPAGHEPAKVLLRARVPAGWKVTGADVDGVKLAADDRGTVVLPSRAGVAHVIFAVSR